MVSSASNQEMLPILPNESSESHSNWNTIENYTMPNHNKVEPVKPKRTVGVVEPRVVVRIPRKSTEKDKKVDPPNGFQEGVVITEKLPAYFKKALENKSAAKSGNESKLSVTSANKCIINESKHELDEGLSGQTNLKDRVTYSAAENKWKKKKKRKLALCQIPQEQNKKQKLAEKSIKDEDEDGSVTNINGTTFKIVQKGSDEKWLFCKRVFDKKPCKFWTNKPHRLERHLKFHQVDHKPLRCPDCPNKTFRSLAKALKHDRMIHTDVPDYECRICEAEVTDIKVHMKVS